MAPSAIQVAIQSRHDDLVVAWACLPRLCLLWAMESLFLHHDQMEKLYHVPSLVELNAGLLLVCHVALVTLCRQRVKPFRQAIFQPQAMKLPQATWFHPGSLSHLLVPPHLLPRLWSSLRRLLSLKSRQKLQHQLPPPGSRHNSCRRS
jgi:hypothetical protein